MPIAMPPEPWQIQLLIRQLEYYSEHRDKTDKNENNIVVYAALAEKQAIELLSNKWPEKFFN